VPPEQDIPEVGEGKSVFVTDREVQQETGAHNAAVKRREQLQRDIERTNAEILERRGRIEVYQKLLSRGGGSDQGGGRDAR
jgi:hypothetical protein